MIQFLLNIFGILNFKVQSGSFKPNDRLLLASIVVFVLFQGNIIYVNFFRGVTGSEYSELLDLLIKADLFSWIFLSAFLFIEKIVNRRKYLKLMNAFLKVEEKCCKNLKNFKLVHEKLKKYLLALWLAKVLLLVVYVPVKFLSDFSRVALLDFIQDSIYAYSLSITVLLNIAVEAALFKSISVYFAFLSEKFQNYYETRQVISSYFETVNLSKRLVATFEVVKIVEIGFLYIAIPIYSFYMYVNVFLPMDNYLVLIYWLIVLIVVTTSCYVWTEPCNQVI